MSTDRLRRQIAHEAARLICSRQETNLHRAKLAAARRVSGGWVKSRDLPTDTEVRDEVHRCVMGHDGQRWDHAVRHAHGEELSENDRFAVYRSLLLPLEQVKENPRFHPEGDALYHSLQVFDLARQRLPYDEEFLLAALLHDVGKAIDPQDHIAAALQALNGTVTLRTRWLIEHHIEGRGLRDRTLGARGMKRLTEAEDSEELLLLVECDQQGRKCGVAVPDVEESLTYLRNLAQECGE